MKDQYKISVHFWLALMLVFCFTVSVLGSETHVVINNHDSGPGSLRYFIEMAQDGDSIRFAQAYFIALESELVLDKKSLWIDGLVGNRKTLLNGLGKTRAITIIGGEDMFLHIRNLQLVNCRADYGGALKAYAMYEYCELILENIDFDVNRADIRGGAAVFAGGIVRNCMFYANHSELDGGAVYANDTEFINCIFLGNTCIERGSVGVLHQNVEIMNGSFIMNEPDLFYSLEPAWFYNSLFWNEFPLFRSPQPGHFVNCVTNGWNETGLTIISESPFVRTPDAGKDTIWGTDDDIINLRLKWGNACINKGMNHEVFYEIPTDFNGDLRIVNDTIDIGAIEYNAAAADSDDDGVMDNLDAYPLDDKRQ